MVTVNKSSHWNAVLALEDHRMALGCYSAIRWRAEALVEGRVASACLQESVYIVA